MALTCISKNKFQKDTFFSCFNETRNYITAFSGPVITRDDSIFVISIKIYNKKMQFIKVIPFKYSCIEKVLVKADKDELAVVCPEHHRLVIVDLESEKVKEIHLPIWPEDEYKNELYPSEFYWWKSDIIFIHTVFNRIYRIDTVESEATIVNMQVLQDECTELYKLLEVAYNFSGIKWVNPHEYQFTYADMETIGFIDVKNDKHYSVLYVAGDIHTIYFYNNIFIVLNCHSIELINAEGINVAYTSSIYNEMERSLFLLSTGELLVSSECWYKTTRYSMLLHFAFDGEIGKFSQKEKEQYEIIKYLKDHSSDINAWLRLILMEKYTNDVLMHKWFDKLRLYDADTIYTLFIISHPDVNGHIYNSLRLSTHDDSEIMAIIKYAMSRYLLKRNDIRRYEQVLLKSIEYCPYHVKNQAALGEFYIKKGRVEEGIRHIKQAINNVKMVYTDKNHNKYDKYDIQEFLDEHFKGIHISEAKYAELHGFISKK